MHFVVQRRSELSDGAKAFSMATAEMPVVLSAAIHHPERDEGKQKIDHAQSWVRSGLSRSELGRLSPE